MTARIIRFAKQAGKTVFVAGDFNAQPTYRAMVTFKNNQFVILNDRSELLIFITPKVVTSQLAGK